MAVDRRFVLGVTGAIGAGKSTACRALEARGWSVLDVDDVAAAAVSAILPKVARQVPEVLDSQGSLNKAALFAAMLRDPQLRQDLERQLRPHVQERIRSWRAHLTGPGVLDAALLFESGLDEFCDATVCVQCARPERRRRVMQRSTASAQHFEALEAAQWSEAEKHARADFAITTTESPAPLAESILAALATRGMHF